MTKQTEAVRAELEAFLDGIEVSEPLRENETTVDQFAERRTLPRDTARKMLLAQMKAGKMTRRKATHDGKFCWAYSLVKK